MSLFHFSESQPQPVFVIQPLNTTVQPINGVMRGAFSCGVYPSNRVESISWYFDSDVGSGEPAPVDSNNANVTVLSAGGTSVLVLDNVGMEQMGGYHCEVALTGSATPLISARGYLQYIGE